MSRCILFPVNVNKNYVLTNISINFKFFFIRMRLSLLNGFCRYYIGVVCIGCRDIATVAKVKCLEVN